GSLTALPIIETQAGDVSAYVPTNVISITDGQIYLESDLFASGIRPAVNAGLSVSRVGGAAQVKAMRQVAGGMRLGLAQYRELQAFAQFGTSDLDAATKRQLDLGQRLTEILKQPQFSPLTLPQEVTIIYAAVNGFLNDVEASKVRAFEAAFHNYMQANQPDLMNEIEEKKEITDDIEGKLKAAIEQFKESVPY
ncbi:MAG: F0F1 ATP synthase subunit alpha, partial [Dehalococcoidia bacterium]